jgi:hypothetical protein
MRVRFFFFIIPRVRPLLGVSSRRVYYRVSIHINVNLYVTTHYNVPIILYAPV